MSHGAPPAGYPKHIIQTWKTFFVGERKRHILMNWRYNLFQPHLEPFFVMGLLLLLLVLLTS